MCFMCCVFNCWDNEPGFAVVSVSSGVINIHTKYGDPIFVWEAKGGGFNTSFGVLLIFIVVSNQQGEQM